MIQKVETLVIGAGVIGSSVAMHLARLGMDQIRVVDFDLEGIYSSSELNAGGVRATWIEPINIEMSKASIEYFAKNAETVGYRSCGYLWLHPASRLDAALRARDRQLKSGWPVEAWDVSELRRKIPFLDKTDGIAGAVFAPRDGLINPNLLKNHYRAEAKKLGVTFEDHTLVEEVTYSRDGLKRAKVNAHQFKGPLSTDDRMKLASQNWESLPRAEVQYEAQRIVNCAGPWASQVAQVLGYSSPAYAMRRQISIFDCREVDLTPYGMIVDTSGVYFHPEASNGLAGFASHNEPRGVNYQYDGESFFMEMIWPALYERSTAFEKLKHLTGWAGLYEVSPDECAILGEVTQGDAGRFGQVYEAHSFSGHGVMHSYSAGQALAEKIFRGRFETLDASSLSAQRFETGQLIQENLII